MPAQPVEANRFKSYKRGGYFNLHEVAHHPIVLEMVYPVRGVLIWVWTLISVYRRSKRREFIAHVMELMTWRFGKRDPLSDCRSLRHVMRDMKPEAGTPSEQSMMPLRLGR
jgi:hypothetical protein